MLFTRLSAAFVAFASVASSIPLSLDALAARDASPVERGLIWTPRRSQNRNDNDRNDNRNRNRKNIIIAQPINIQLTQIQIIQDIRIVNVIQNIVVVVGLDDARDNIRRNHYRNRNQNNDVNIVIIVVVVVVDERDERNRNVRYMTRQLESNPERPNKQWVVVTEQSTLTVSSEAPGATGDARPTEVGSAPEVFPTGEAPRQFGVYDPAAPLQLGSGEAELLPANIVAPSWSGASQERDPAIIIEPNQIVIVVFGDDNNDNNRDDRNDNDRNNNDRNDNRDGNRGN